MFFFIYLLMFATLVTQTFNYERASFSKIYAYFLFDFGDKTKLVGYGGDMASQKVSVNTE